MSSAAAWTAACVLGAGLAGSPVGRWPFWQIGPEPEAQPSIGTWMLFRYAMRSLICWSFIGPPPATPHADIGENGRP